MFKITLVAIAVRMAISPPVQGESLIILGA